MTLAMACRTVGAMELRPSTVAWGVLGASVLAYDVLCPQGETLSEGVDRALEHNKFKYVAMGAVAVTAAHLLNYIPESIDPFTRALRWKDEQS
jgi:hypothetical protein